MRRGALKGAASAWLGLIVLQVATTNRGSGAVSGALAAVASVVERALSPDVAAIPDLAHRTGRDEEPAPVPAGGGKTESTPTDFSKIPGVTTGPK